MADFLIMHLSKMADEHSSLKLLLNQWGFDEKLIPKALQTVGNLFPHYSRHDESHSRQILVNIERLLGENIALLTATDTWLLLEAAYWHDIGMVVPQQDLAAALADPDFERYLEQTRNTEHHELQHFARTFKPDNLSHCFNGADSPLDAMDKFRQLMAEWFRRHHAGRANQIIQTPWDSVGISSPRTELIPARLFKLLGHICQMHGLPFKQLLAALPFREAGLAQEDCHPRFVACLLRMGDLLDLDDNRFCPVMQRIAGDDRPLLSRAHEDKHSSIRHLRLDRERIEISAECATIPGYLECFKWFDWLKQEMQDQMSRWQDIVPSRVFGLLPTLGDLVIRISGDQQILSEGQRPQFSIDGPQVFKLLQGNNLYSTKFPCIRELLQNAADATLLRIWLGESKRVKPENWLSPFTPYAKKALTNANITVELMQLAPLMEMATDETRWQLTIIDQGTGISREDLAHMLRIGGSQGNLARQMEIRKMPEWMKPSGTFGIGFQSAFLISNVVKIRSKSIFTNEILDITMHSPTGEEQGLVLFKPLPNDFSLPFGTRLEIIFTLQGHGNWDPNRESSHTTAYFARHDPIIADKLIVPAVMLADEIESFSENSLIQIQGTLSHLQDGAEAASCATLRPVNPVQENRRFMEVNGQFLTLSYKPFFDNGAIISNVQYRGQKIRYPLLRLPNAHVSINLMSGKAGDWITANREQFTDAGFTLLKQTTLAALEKAVAEDLAALSAHDGKEDAKPGWSFFLEGMKLQFGGNWQALAKQLDGAWLKHHGDIDFEALFAKPAWRIGVYRNTPPVGSSNDLLLKSAPNSTLLGTIIQTWQARQPRSIKIIAPDHPALDYCLSLKNEIQPPWDAAALARQLLNNGLRERMGNHRYLLACDDTWKALRLKDETAISAEPLFDLPIGNQGYLLLPFLFNGKRAHQHPGKVSLTPKQLEALCQWAQTNLAEPLAPEEIRRLYLSLADYIDNTVMEEGKAHTAWMAVRVG